jgi:hypothetical protein
MKKLYFAFALFTCISFSGYAQTWISLATDITGDGTFPGLLDGKALSYRYDPSTDSIFFKVYVTAAVSPPFGVNIILRVNAPSLTDTNWNTSQNTNFRFNRVINAWAITDSLGFFGICDANGFRSGFYDNIKNGGLSVTVFFTDNSYVIGTKLKYIYNYTGSFDADVIAAVGSDQNWNDDIPNSGSGHFTINHTSINNVIGNQKIELYPNPAKDILYIKLPISGPIDIKIYDMLGNVVYRKSFQGASDLLQLNVGHLSDGEYNVNIKCMNNIVYLQKFMKN